MSRFFTVQFSVYFAIIVKRRLRYSAIKKLIVLQPYFL